MRTDEQAPKPRPEKPVDLGWFPGLYHLSLWHRLKGHQVGTIRARFGGLWDGTCTITVTCYTCDADWKHVVL